MAYDGPKVFSAEVKEEVERREMKTLLRGACIMHHWALAAFAQGLEMRARERRALRVLRLKLLPVWQLMQVSVPPGAVRLRQKYYAELPSEQLLVRHELCSLLSQKDLFRITHSLAMVHAPAGTVLVAKGELTTRSFLVKSGTIVRDDGVVYQQGWAGDTPATVDDVVPARWRLRADTDCVLWIFDANRAQRLLSDEGKVTAKELTAERLVRRMEEVGLTSSDLRQSKLFADFSEVDLNAITASAAPHYVPPMGTVFEQGDPAECVYFLLEGEVECTETIEARRVRKTNRLQHVLTHNLLGAEDALLTTGEAAHSSTLTAVTGCKLWSLPVFHLRPYFATRPKEYAELRKHLLQRLNTRRSACNVGIPLQMLKSCSTFADWHVQLLTEMRRHFKPIAFKQGHMITDKRVDAGAVFMVTKGDSLVMGGAKTNNAFGVHLEPCGLIGFWEVMFGTNSKQNIKCLTPCEAYYLNPEDLKKIYTALNPLPTDWVSRMQNEALLWCLENSEPVISERLRSMKNMDFCDTYLALPSFINLRRQPVTGQEKLLRQDEMEAAERKKLIEKMKEHLAKDPNYSNGNLNLQAVREEMKEIKGCVESAKLLKRRMYLEQNKKRFRSAASSPKPPAARAVRPSARKPCAAPVPYPPIKLTESTEPTTKAKYSSVLESIYNMKKRQLKLIATPPHRAASVPQHPPLYAPTPPPHLQALDKSAYRGYRGRSVP